MEKNTDYLALIFSKLWVIVIKLSFRNIELSCFVLKSYLAYKFYLGVCFILKHKYKVAFKQ